MQSPWLSPPLELDLATQSALVTSTQANTHMGQIDSSWIPRMERVACPFTSSDQNSEKFKRRAKEGKDPRSKGSQVCATLSIHPIHPEPVGPSGAHSTHQHLLLPGSIAIWSLGPSGSQWEKGQPELSASQPFQVSLQMRGSTLSIVLQV